MKNYLIILFLFVCSLGFGQSIIQGDTTIYIDSDSVGVQGALNVTGTTYLTGVSVSTDSIATTATVNLNLNSGVNRQYILVDQITTINITALPEGYSEIILEQDATGYAVTIGTGFGTYRGTGAINTAANATSYIQIRKATLSGGHQILNYWID